MGRMDREDIRRNQLIGATIDILSEVGFSATTLALIGQKAGVSPGLVAHYFRDKDGLLEATLRLLAVRLARVTIAHLTTAVTPRQRIQAVIDSYLAPEQYDRRTSTVWLAFWGEALHSPRLKRVEEIYQRRMLSNLRHAFRRLVPAEDAPRLAIAVAAMIDGLWLRSTLSSGTETDSATARSLVTAFVDQQIAQARQRPDPVAAQPGQGRERSYIDGTCCPATDAASLMSHNPATGEVLAELQPAGPDEIDAAAAAARRGQRHWSRMTGAERSRVLFRIADSLRERSEALALIEAQDSGRPLTLAAMDVLRCAEEFDHFALAGGETIGVVPARGGWRTPLLTTCRQAAPALAGGNAVIYTPHPLASLSALKLAEIMTKAGLPDGAFNVLLTDDEIEEDAPRPVVIVPEDAEIEPALAAAETALCGGLLFLHRRIKDSFLDRLLERVERMPIGDPRLPATRIGPLISREHLDRALAHIAGGDREGAHLLTGGDPVGKGALAKGHFLQPTIFDAHSDRLGVVRQDSCGPLLTVLTFHDEAELAARLAALPGNLAVCSQPGVKSIRRA